MYKETLEKIEARIRLARQLRPETQKELLKLMEILRDEVAQLSDEQTEQSESISRFAESSTHEALREQKNPQLIDLSIDGFKKSVEEFEASHPKLTKAVNDICTTLAKLGI